MTLALEKNSVRSVGILSDPVVDLLRDILGELKGLRKDLAQNIQPSRRHENLDFPVLNREDRARLARLLPAIGGALGSEPFLARDLFEHESAAVRLVLRGLNTRQVGRLLHRAEGQAVDGYLVERGDVELGAVLWRVVQVPKFPGNEKVSVPPRHPAGLP